jgi:hypothetical protein
MGDGIRPRDRGVFAEAAKEFQVWIVMRQTNEASWKYIGLPKYFPKPITCKAKTANLDSFLGPSFPRVRYDTAGLVVNPEIHNNVYGGAKPDAGDLWRDFRRRYLDVRGSDYAVDMDCRSRHFGCVIYQDKYLHGDYDLYDIIVVGHERANLAVVGTRDGAADYRPARLLPIEEFVNGRIGAEMVHHGGQFQYSKHTDDVVEVFGPNGETFVGAAAGWYKKYFPDRKPPGPKGGFKAMK